MATIRSFDDAPDLSRVGAVVRIGLVLLAAAILPAGILWGSAAAGWTFLAAFVAFLGERMARELFAIVMHTTYRLLELWLGVVLCGSAAGGIIAGFSALMEYVSDPDARVGGWISCACVVLVALWLLLRGLYYGLRLAMWLKAEGRERLGLLLLGFAGFFAQILWKAFAVMALLALLAFGNTPPVTNEHLVYLGVSLAGTGIFYQITRLHLRYRQRAQANYEADPYALGQAGCLASVGGRSDLRYLLYNRRAFLRRLLGGGRE
ncbi:MAG: hypothetical protein L6R28_04785 [Planctomycetes bacterium]|nr:hypothetical protein [Planctomycetota bacterium]